MFSGIEILFKMFPDFKLLILCIIFNDVYSIIWWIAFAVTLNFSDTWIYAFRNY